MLDKDFIKKSFLEIKSNLAKNVTLLAVSKFQSIEKVEYLHSLGQNDFGENYLQELEQKAQVLSHLNWHFIGAIQSRKIKNIVKYASTIQSIESLEQLEKINTHAEKLNKNINIYLQVNIDNDENKSGFSSGDTDKILNCIAKSKNLSNIKIIGLMCLPTKSDNSENSFIKMKSFFDDLNSKLETKYKLTQLSMGMSGDYKTAIKHGSSIVRIGSRLFGERNK
jgi:hypothetical protein